MRFAERTHDEAHSAFSRRRVDRVVGCPEQSRGADGAPSSAYQEVKDWPSLPPGVQLGEVAGVDIDAHGHVFVFHRPGRGFEPGATELLEQPAVLEFDEKSGDARRVVGRAGRFSSRTGSPSTARATSG